MTGLTPASVVQLRWTHDVEKGDKSPFHEYNETSFSMNMSKAKQLGYTTSNINEWFWDLLDRYIERALKEK